MKFVQASGMGCSNVAVCVGDCEKYVKLCKSPTKLAILTGYNDQTER